MKASLDLSARIETADRQRVETDAAPRVHTEGHWPLRDALGLTAFTLAFGLIGQAIRPQDRSVTAAAIMIALMLMTGWAINEMFFCETHRNRG